MPEPEPGETAEAFIRRWYARALEHLDRAMLSDPRNLMCGTGVWTMDEPHYLVGSARKAAWERRRTRVISLAPSGTGSPGFKSMRGDPDRAVLPSTAEIGVKA
jgi:hypothetical protein